MLTEKDKENLVKNANNIYKKDSINTQVQVLTFLKIELGFTEKIVSEVKNMPEIKEIFYITGEYDLALWIRTENNEDLYEVIVNKLDQLPGVEKIMSHYVMKRISN